MDLCRSEKKWKTLHTERMAGASGHALSEQKKESEGERYAQTAQTQKIFRLCV